MAEMTADTTALPDPRWRPLYRAAAVSAAIFVVLTVASIVAVAVTGFPGGGALPNGQATLEYIGANRTAFIVDELLIQGPFLVMICFFMALYAALRDVSRSYAALGAVVGIAYVVATLSTFTIAFGLVSLSDLYAAAVTEARHAALAAAADGLVAQLNAVSAAAVLGNLSFVILSLLMLRGVFPRWVAYLGALTGAAGVVSEALRPVLGVGFGLYGVLLLVWTAAVAWRLYRLSQDAERQPLTSRLPYQAIT
jgi:Domain of unknown function (DUF4386)